MFYSNQETTERFLQFKIISVGLKTQTDGQIDIFLLCSIDISINTLTSFITLNLLSSRTLLSNTLANLQTKKIKFLFYILKLKMLLNSYQCFIVKLFYIKLRGEWGLGGFLP